MLNLYSQITLPVSTSSAITRSCRAGPRPDGFWTYRRWPITIGAERPPKGTRHRRLLPLRSHEDGSPVSAEEPSRCAPRASGQSPSATRRPVASEVEGGTWACADAAMPMQTAMERISLMRIEVLRDDRMLLEYFWSEKAAYQGVV